MENDPESATTKGAGADQIDGPTALQKDDSNTYHVEVNLDQHQQQLGHLANQEEHENGRLASLKKYPWACAWCLYACWCLVLTGFENQAGGAVLGIPKFREDFGEAFENDWVLPAEWQSAFNAAPAASGVVGSLGAAMIADRIGRRLTIVLALLVPFAAISMEVAATTRELFFGGKFLNGFAIGTIGAVMATYIGELWLRDIDSHWAYRIVICTQFGFAGVAAILVPFMPESPWWLVRMGHREKALKSINKLGHKGVQGEKRLATIELTLEQIKVETMGMTYLECFRKSNLRRTMISIAPLVIQSITGIQWVAGYFTYYLQLAGYSTSDSFKIQVAQPVLSIVGNLMAAFLVDRVGRRDLTFWGLAILVVFLFITGGLAVGGSPSEIKGTVAMILLYSWMYNVSIGSTAFTILSETSTSRLRVKTVAIGLSSQGSINVMWQFVLPYMFNPDKANLGGKIDFIFSGPSFLCLLYLWFQQPETANRTYEELDEMFAKRVPAREFKHYQTESQAMGEAVKASVTNSKLEG